MRQTAITEFKKVIDDLGMQATEKSQAPTDPESPILGDAVFVWCTNSSGALSSPMGKHFLLYPNGPTRF